MVLVEVSEWAGPRMRQYELYLYPAGRGGYAARYYDSCLVGGYRAFM